jgi:hypothetical protein
MSLTGLFEELDAPLANNRWSWGAVREQDQAVFLRVWQDGCKKLPEFGAGYFAWVANAPYTNNSLGESERNRHIELIKNGAKAYVIICIDEGHSEGDGRKIDDFDNDSLHVGGIVVEYDNSFFMQLVDRVPTKDVKLKK